MYLWVRECVMLLLVIILVRETESFNIKYRNTRFNAHMSMSKSKMWINVKFLTASCYCSWAHLLGNGDDYLHYIRPCGMGSELLSVF